MSKSKLLNHLTFCLLVIAIFVLIFDLGFNKNLYIRQILFWFYHISLGISFLSILFRYFSSSYSPKLSVKIFDLFLLIVIVIDVVVNNFFLYSPSYVIHPLIYITFFVLFLRELSDLNIIFKRSYFNPAQLFIISFLVLILLGTGLLMLPKATHEGIAFIDALFTATSAVCVTGLVVVDTGSYFTGFGHTIILILVQFGGIGIMTFTTYFSYFFRGGTSYENHLMLKDIVSADKLSDVFGMLKKIIFFTVGIELIGAIFIFFNLDQSVFDSGSDQVFFAVFHAISGFCNAGFSTLKHGLVEVGFRFNYPLQLILMFLFVLGGIGFPILFNASTYLKHQIFHKWIPQRKKKTVVHKPWIINVNTRIVLTTTLILLVGGTFLFYIFEYNNTLAPHSGYGKIVAAVFGAASPRTAGFNTVPIEVLNLHTIMIVIFLMWIGASPGSTGGGIKTSTIALATLNFFSLARGKDRVEVYKREISHNSIRRAFAIISLSLIVTGTSTFLLITFEDNDNLIALAFEAFSAYSTTGLSMGVTPELSSIGKLIITITMFIGRVSMINFLVALLRTVDNQSYHYPTESVLIN
ncbi:MAG TPA: potassium transporter TrkG [Salinimicrobium sp.]|nr:potassium transporter TrkG [Salinimicrobium sp.]